MSLIDSIASVMQSKKKAFLSSKINLLNPKNCFYEKNLY